MARREAKRSAANSSTRHNRTVLTERLELRRLLAADLVISEFLASNQTNIVDNFGDHSDWIEIFNRGDTAANLNDYFLTDDAALPAKWRFPLQSLAAGAYLLVYASDRNLAVAGQPLHTNFKLSAGGEYLGLMRANGTAQSEFAPTFPAQTGDVSYGMIDERDPASALHYFGTPTPGAVNVPGASPAVFSVPGKVFSGTMQVTLSSPTPGAQIRYTLNRTDPTAASLLYTGPITLSATAVIRARVYASGFNASPIVGHSFIRVDAPTASFDTNLGLIVVDVHGATLSDTTYSGASAAFIDNAGDGRAGMLSSPDYIGRIGIRVRGSSSQDFPKKQFAVELWDQSNNDISLPLFGMPADSDWVLYAPYAEKSLMQNALAFDWSRATGHYAPRVKFVELYLNTTTSTTLTASNYWGVYMLVEKIKVSPDRVDIAELGANDTTEPNVTGGYLWKKDRIDPDEQVITTNSGQEFVMVDPDTLTTAQTTWLRTHLNQFETALNGANFRDPILGYARYIDVNSWIDHWLLTEMAKQIDGFRLSTFYYKDRNGKINMGPQWDFNLSMGNSYYLDGNNSAGWYSSQLSPSEYPYFGRLMQDPAFKQKLVDRWSTLRETTFATSTLMANIDAYVGALSDNNGNYPVGTVPTQVSNNPVVRNFKRWNQLGVYNWPNGFYDLQGRWIEDIKMMKNWLAGRVAWMDSQLLPAPVASVEEGFRNTPAQVTLTPNRVNDVDTTLVGSTAPVRAIIPTSDLTGWTGLSYNATSWLSGTNGVGYDTNTAGVNYNPLIGLNVSSMLNTRTSVFVRIPFTVANPADIQSLVLKMKFDDGFVAYLNGHQIAQFNDPAFNSDNPYYRSWTSTATAIRDDQQAITFQEWDVTAWKSLLVAGSNVLAIHGMNQASNSSDLLVLPELVSRARVGPGTANTSVYYTLDGTDPLRSDGTTLSTSALLYTGPINVSTTTRIKSRSLRGTWSGLSSDYYVFATESLRVSEVMYNPNVPAGGTYPAQEYEFIELQNTGSQALPLAGYRFVEGIEHTFGDVILPAGGFAVLVKNPLAFQERYGSAIVPAGVYGGSLDNAGDTLILRDPFGQIAEQFTYDNAWYPSTDGNGSSLEALAPGQRDLSLASSWRASTQASPGAADLLAPTVLQAEYAFDVAPNQIRIRFSESVEASLDLSDLVVMNLGNLATVSPLALSYDAATQTATFTFPLLPDGNYRARLSGASISDSAGNRMSDVDVDFFVLAGDVNRDRTVNFDDLLTLSQNYGQTGRTFSQGNIDYSADGLVGFDDLLMLAQRYGNSIPIGQLNGVSKRSSRTISNVLT